MTRKLMLTLTLAVVLGTVPLVVQAAPSPTPVPDPASPPSSEAGPALVTPTAPAAPAGLPAGPLDGALFMTDEECENSCFQQYFECAIGCSACDQCSCQLALCRAGCGVPYTGC